MTAETKPKKPLEAHNSKVPEALAGAIDKLQGEEENHVTPTRVLRSGRRIAATPQPSLTAKKRAARVPVDEAPKTAKKAPKRVPIGPEQERQQDEAPASTTKLKQRAKRQPVDQSKQATPGTRGGDSAIKESPIPGLVKDAGTIRLSAEQREENTPPPGLLTEVRRAQQEIHEEHRLSDLRAEIIAAQEDIRMEEENSAATVITRRTDTGSSASASRYQDTPSSRAQVGPFGRRLDQTDASSTTEVAGEPHSLRAPQNTPAAGNLVPLEELIKTSSDSDDDDDDAEPRLRSRLQSATKSGASTGSAATEIRARMASLRMSQETQGTELDTDSSDTAEKLDALRTKMALEDRPEAADLVELAASEDSPTAPDGFVPREAPGPSYMERKLMQLKETEWAGPQELMVHSSRLELMKQEAAASKRDELGSVEKAITRKLVQQAVTKAVQSEGKSLEESLVPHKSRLEREKEAAVARVSTPRLQKKQPSATQGAQQGLDQVLQKHKSRLQVEKEAAGAREGLPSYMRPTAAFRHATTNPTGLAETLVVHKSRLEKEKEKAAAGKDPRQATPRNQGSATERHAAAARNIGRLSDLKVHKSKLEREKEQAARRPHPPPLPPPRPSSTLKLPAWNSSSSLSDLKIHKSRLEKEKEAWEKAGARQQK